MNYRHAFHAGNFADVHKHVTLLTLMAALLRKDTPFVVLETHAGAGLYDLSGDEARRTGEWRHGIARLRDDATAPAMVRLYLERVRAYNPQAQLRLYPGSPVLAADSLRAHDRLVLCELEPGAHGALSEALKGRKGIAIHRRDGWEALKALLPPREAKRGLVLIDPPFEAANELERLAQALPAAWRRWPQGVFAAWYPLKDRPPLERFLRTLRSADLPDVLVSELSIHPPLGNIQLHGSGMVIVNAPWKLEDPLREATAWLHGQLAQTPTAPWRVERWA